MYVAAISQQACAIQAKKKLAKNLKRKSIDKERGRNEARTWQAKESSQSN